MTLASPAKPSRVLVTGASGFLGQHVVRALLQRGSLVVAHTHTSALPEELANRCDRIVVGDICDGAIQRAMLDDVQAVCHTAACIPLTYTGLDDAARCFSVNAQATLDLATQAAKRGVSRFAHFSTGNLYSYNGNQVFTESDRVFPAEFATDYMVSKMAAEIFLTNISARLPIEVVILRVATPYGPGEPPNKVVPTFLRSAVRGDDLRLLDGGRATFNFVHAADVAELAVVALKGSCSGIYNVAAGENISLLELANAVASLNTDTGIHVEPRGGDGFPGFPPISIEKAKAAFDYSPRPLIAGLKDYRLFLLNEACE